MHICTQSLGNDRISWKKNTLVVNCVCTISSFLLLWCILSIICVTLHLIRNYCTIRIRFERSEISFSKIDDFRSILFQLPISSQVQTVQIQFLYVWKVHIRKRTTVYSDPFYDQNSGISEKLFQQSGKFLDCLGSAITLKKIILFNYTHQYQYGTIQ